MKTKKGEPPEGNLKIVRKTMSAPSSNTQGECSVPAPISKPSRNRGRDATFRLDTIEDLFWLSLADGTKALLVQARGRGWFIDTRRYESVAPPSGAALIACLVDRLESGFVPC